MAVDKFPQWLNLTSAVQTSATGFIESETAMPVRIQALEVMEILAIEYEFSGGSMQSVDAEFSNALIANIYENSRTANIALNDSRCVDKAIIVLSMVTPESTETGAAGYAYENIILHDFAKGGKGFLYAGQSMFVGVDQDALAVSLLTVAARVLYRLVKVTANELIGLVRQ